MDCRVIVSPSAVNDLREIVKYIARDDPETAQRFGERLLERAMSLATFPERGHFVREFSDNHTRELLLGPYRIIYRYHADENSVHIARFWHGARMLKPEN